MKRLFKWIAIVVLLSVLAMLCWLLTLWQRWPAAAAWVLFLAILAGALLTRYLWRKVRAWRTRSLEAEPVEKARAAERHPMTLQRQWKAATTLLKHSQLRRFRHPLQVLPWFMLLGRPGSGKSALLAQSGLAAPLDLPHELNDGKAPVDWWYFDKAVILDISGQFVQPEASQETRSTWNRMLDLLGRDRARAGLNGLVLTVSAQTLLSADGGGVVDEGRLIRTRIEQLIRLFDRRFPVYVLVTQIDSLYGMEAWSHLLTPEALDQAMGHVVDEPENGRDVRDVIDIALGRVNSRLKTMQLTMLLQHPDADPALLMFPTELARLAEPLKRYVYHALGDSPYLESPILRGVFFASAVQKGNTRSGPEDQQEIALQEAAHDTVKRGVFVRDLFNRVLPADRHLNRPVAVTSPWRRLNRHLGLFAWWLCVAAALGYLGVSVVYWQHTLDDLRQRYPATMAMNRALPHDMQMMIAQRDAIYWLENRNAQWASRVLAFQHQLLSVEADAKSQYVNDFSQYILPSLDKAIQQSTTADSIASHPDGLVNAIQVEVRRANLLRARLRGSSYGALMAMPPIPTPPLRLLYPALDSDTVSRFNDLFLAQLAWSTDIQQQNARLLHLQARLRQLAAQSATLDWIIPWANAQPDLTSVTLDDFWQGSLRPDKLPEVDAAYTLEGQQRIRAFLVEMRSSMPNDIAFDKKRAAFWHEYAQKRLQAWQDFAGQFSQGERILAGQGEWQSTIDRLPHDDNPYLRLALRLLTEFAEMPDDLRPGWLRVLPQWLEIRQRAHQQALVRVPGLVSDVGGMILRGTAQKGALDQTRSQFVGRLDAIRLYQEYQAAMTQAMNSVVISQAQATKVAADFHGFDSQQSGQSSLQTAYARLMSLRSLLGYNRPDEQLTWGLMAGPLQLVIRYADQQASCFLQSAWQDRVIAPSRWTLNQAERADKLYGDNGLLWTFLSGPIKPFIQRNDSGWQEVDTLGQSVPFTADFLPFINRALIRQVDLKAGKIALHQKQQQATLAQQQQKQRWQTVAAESGEKLAELNTAAAALKAKSYPVALTGLPTDVNSNAKAKVVGTLLTMQCTNATLRLNNLNFAVMQSVLWSQQQCGQVTLQIRLPTFTLTRSYPGPQGFVHFLRDFPGGARRFTPADFPVDKSRMAAVGLTQITVRYRIAGQETLLQDAAQLAQAERDIQSAQTRQQQAQQALLTLNRPSASESLPPLDTLPGLTMMSVPERIGQCWRGDIRLARENDGIGRLMSELVAKQLSDKP
ncbi:type VI secretion protein IcmF/TssM N-terminal domain-containing protein [Edwardsiella piscicida]|uniref:type VI secretion protein IcmF/TssM N-terminal domain-containing protein n=1 Tax=Edwardsiella piscicida TaxID=1263550 RepID=UPI000933E61F|nr:type VI secretion protein IcmF/TssM N-terminal domain-containing protein [Edwardsiella piscicida]WAM43636.1 type VI secretion system protein ImpL [Edwardsiella piscicida]